MSGLDLLQFLLQILFYYKFLKGVEHVLNVYI